MYTAKIDFIKLAYTLTKVKERHLLTKYERIEYAAVWYQVMNRDIVGVNP